MPFTVGHQLATGRPKGSKNQLTLAKDRIVKYAAKCVKDSTFMEKIPPADFLRFIASITPKDLKIHIPNISYHSNVPSIEAQPKALITDAVVDAVKTHTNTDEPANVAWVAVSPVKSTTDKDNSTNNDTEME